MSTEAKVVIWAILVFFICILWLFIGLVVLAVVQAFVGPKGPDYTDSRGNKWEFSHKTAVRYMNGYQSIEPHPVYKPYTDDTNDHSFRWWWWIFGRPALVIGGIALLLIVIGSLLI